MSKVVIGIHGIGNKPPKDLLKEWWLKSFSEGLKKINSNNRTFDFEIVYWADIFNKEPLLPEDAKDKNSPFIKESYVPEEESVLDKTPGFRKKAADFLEKYYDKIIVDEVMSLEYPTLTNFLIHYNMRELEAYYSKEDFYYQGEKRLIKEVMIERLNNVLMRFREKKIMLVAHSMGSMIAHDTLMNNLSNLKIDTFVTIGSPLGQKYVLKKMESEYKNDSTSRLKVPENILKNWYNLSDPEDQVAVVHSLSDIYKENSKGMKVIDKLVKNNYVNSGDRNPHKSYGYLRTPEFAEILSNFLTVEKRSIFSFFKKIF